MNIKQLAQTINDDCADFEYYWAFGLLRETRKVWMVDGNKNLLCDTAKVMLDQIGETNDNS
jgi:hypothetical protein